MRAHRENIHFCIREILTLFVAPRLLHNRSDCLEHTRVSETTTRHDNNSLTPSNKYNNGIIQNATEPQQQRNNYGQITTPNDVIRALTTVYVVGRWWHAGISSILRCSFGRTNAECVLIGRPARQDWIHVTSARADGIDGPLARKRVSCVSSGVLPAMLCRMPSSMRCVLRMGGRSVWVGYRWVARRHEWMCLYCTYTNQLSTYYTYL